MTIYNLNVSEPWFTCIRFGLKTVEGRLNRGTLVTIKRGDIIIINEVIRCEVLRVSTYPDFKTYLKEEGLVKTLPGILTIEDGIKIYRQFYSEEKERDFGVMAIEIHVI